MDEEFKKQLIDRFEGYEIVDLLRIEADEVVDAFEEQILEAEEDLRDFLEHGR